MPVQVRPPAYLIDKRNTAGMSSFSYFFIIKAVAGKVSEFSWEGDSMQDIVFELQDMRDLDWAVQKMSPGTPGCFLKVYEELDDKKV